MHFLETEAQANDKILFQGWGSFVTIKTNNQAIQIDRKFFLNSEYNEQIKLNHSATETD